MMMIILISALLISLVAAALLTARIVLECSPPFREPAPSAPDGPIPRRIWTFWHSGEERMAGFQRQCLANWRRLCPNWTVTVVSYKTVGQFLSNRELGRGRLFLPWHWLPIPSRHQHFADTLRVALLGKFGGVWLDCSIALTEPLDWVQASGKPFIAFTFDSKFQTSPKHPRAIENWFLAAQPGAPFVRALHSELARVASAGPAVRAVYPAYLTRQNVDLGRNDLKWYLWCHIAIQFLLQRHPDRDSWEMELLRAEDGPFWLQNTYGWTKFADHITRHDVDGFWEKRPKLIKVTGAGRKFAGKRLDCQGSLTARLFS